MMKTIRKRILFQGRVQGIQNDILLFLDDLNDDLYIRIEQIREKEIPLVDEIGFQMKY